MNVMLFGLIILASEASETLSGKQIEVGDIFIYIYSRRQKKFPYIT